MFANVTAQLTKFRVFFDNFFISAMEFMGRLEIELMTVFGSLAHNLLEMSLDLQMLISSWLERTGLCSLLRLLPRK